MPHEYYRSGVSSATTRRNFVPETKIGVFGDTVEGGDGAGQLRYPVTGSASKSSEMERFRGAGSGDGLELIGVGETLASI